MVSEWKVEMDNRQKSPGVLYRRTQINGGSSMHTSGASFARHLVVWLYAQQRFPRQRDFAAAIGASLEALQRWLSGRAFPSEAFCDKLFAVTQIECFSPGGRVTARTEYIRMRGLSQTAIAKRAAREFISAEELAECREDPGLAFTVRGDEWVACLECGQLLKFIRGAGAAAHLKEHGMSAEEYRIGSNPKRPRYGRRRGLVCNLLAKTRREHAWQRGSVFELPRFVGKRASWNLSTEAVRRLSARMKGRRNPRWSKDVADVEFVWAWLIEGKDLICTGKDLHFTSAGVWVRLKAIIG